VAGAFDFAALGLRIEAATRRAFGEMMELHGSEGVYAFALYSDEGAMTVCPSTNTRAYLQAQAAEEADEAAYYKFAPAEWACEMEGADAAFDAISTLLREHVLSFEEDDEAAFVAFRDTLYETCISVLEKLRGEGYFRQAAGEDVFLTFEVSDHEFSPEETRAIITRLNDKAYQDEYFAWMASWEA